MPDFGPLGNALINYGTLVFLVAGLIELAFLIHYIVVAPAFKSGIGWMFVLRSTSFLFAGLAILLGRVLGPDYPERPYVTFGLYLLILASACLTYAVFLNARRHSRKGEPRKHRVMNFTRRALGLPAKVYLAPETEERRPDTRPLKIVGE